MSGQRQTQWKGCHTVVLMKAKASSASASTSGTRPAFQASQARLALATPAYSHEAASVPSIACGAREATASRSWRRRAVSFR